MAKNKLHVIFFMILLGFLLLLTGCGMLKEAVREAAEENAEQATNEEAEEEQTVGEEENSQIPDDDTLISVIENNAQAFAAGDIEAYMATIHPESPLYESTRETVQAILETYQIDVILSDLEVVEKSETEAKVKFTQFSAKVAGPDDYLDNSIKGYHILQPDGDEWKIYHSEMEDFVYLQTFDLNNQQQNVDINEEMIDVIAQSQFFSKIENLDFVIDDRNWKLDYYDENHDSLIAEFVLENESVFAWSELYTIHFFQDFKTDVGGISGYIKQMEYLLHEEIEGDLVFNSWEIGETEGFYEFIVANDPIQDDQHELARVFAHGNDIYLVRYTIIGEPLDDATREFWINQLTKATVMQ